MPARMPFLFLSASLLVNSAFCFAEDIVRSLDDAAQLRLTNLDASPGVYHDRQCLHLTVNAAGDNLAVIDGVEITSGRIQLELVGKPRPEAPRFAKGFVGVAFRLQETSPASYECFYLRPVNARSNDQRQRNHTLQYVSSPDFPWQRLREEEPEKYESYVDLETGEWTDVRIDIQGTTAKLFINGAQQPGLIVNDMKLGERAGAIAVWVHPTTDAFVRNLRVTGRH